MSVHILHIPQSLINNTIDIYTHYNNHELSIEHNIKKFTFNSYNVIDYKLEPPNYRGNTKNILFAPPNFLLCQRHYFYFLFVLLTQTFPPFATTIPSTLDDVDLKG
jgi:hypothetical protein